MTVGGVAFDSPAWLVLLGLVPALVAFFALALRARRRALAALLGERARDRIATMPGRDRRGAEAAFAVLTAALVVTALAGPRWGLEKERVERTGVDVAIVLDTSRSMLAEDVAPSRMARAAREVRGLLDAAPGSRIAIITFAGRAHVLCPFTLDHDVVGLFLEDLDPGSDHAGGSNLAAGLAAAAEALEGSSGIGRAVVVLSDGEDPSQGAGVAAAARKLAARGARVHAISLGTTEGGKIPVADDEGRTTFLRDDRGDEVVTKANPATLAAAASAGGGEHLDASSVAFPMDEIWRKRISTLAQGSTGHDDIESLQPRFQWFLAAALVTASLWWLAPLGIAVRTKRPGTVRGLAWTRAAFFLALAMAALAPVRASAGPSDDGREGDALYRAGEYTKAAAAYETAGRGRTSDLAAHNLGNARYRAAQYGAAAKAWADAEKMATANDARRDAHYNRGNALVRQAETDATMSVELLEEAIRSYDAALGLDPVDGDARNNRAIAIARWVDAQKRAQRGEKRPQPDGNQGPQDPQQQQPSQSSSPDGKPGERRPGESEDGTEEPGEENGSPEAPDRMGQAEMERIDRLLEEKEREQRKIQHLKGRMHRKPGENSW